MTQYYSRIKKKVNRKLWT